jgi:hypothetical protein
MATDLLLAVRRCWAGRCWSLVLRQVVVRRRTCRQILWTCPASMCAVELKFASHTSSTQTLPLVCLVMQGASPCLVKSTVALTQLRLRATYICISSAWPHRVRTCSSGSSTFRKGQTVLFLFAPAESRSQPILITHAFDSSHPLNDHPHLFSTTNSIASFASKASLCPDTYNRLLTTHL